MYYTFKFFIDNIRIAPMRLSTVNARLLYKELKEFMSAYERKYHSRLSDTSVLIIIDGKEIFRDKYKLKSMGINTIQDIVEYFEVQPKYIIADDVLVENGDIYNIYVLELYSDWSFLTQKRIKKYVRG